MSSNKIISELTLAKDAFRSHVLSKINELSPRSMFLVPLPAFVDREELSATLKEVQPSTIYWHFYDDPESDDSLVYRKALPDLWRNATTARLLVGSKG